MRLHRFYIENKIESEAFEVFDRELIHQWRKVFRYNVGSQVIIFDGFGFDYLCLITSFKPSGAELKVLNKKENHNPERSIWLCQALIKKDNFELVVEKTTELGVSNIIPIIAERSEKKKINQNRLDKITKESSEQSGKGILPKIHQIIELGKILDSGVLPQEKIFLHPDMPNVREYMKSNTEQRSFALFIGPEGGWSDREIDLFKKYNISGFSLGQQILRAETASIAVSSLFLLS